MYFFNYFMSLGSQPMYNPFMGILQPADRHFSWEVGEMEKYLVTGACGFTGSHTCDILSEAGVPFRATDLEKADRRWLPQGTEFIAADLTAPDSLKPVLDGIDVVLHPAAVFSWSASEEQLHAVNVQGMENLCAEAKRAGARRLISWSTSGVYGDQKFDELPITEDYPVKPIDKYSLSKYRQDQIALRYNNEEGLPATIIRPGIVYGPRSSYGAMQFFDLCALLPVVPIPENFNYKLGTIHVRDIGRSALFLSTRKEAAGEIYGLVDSSDVTIRDFLRLIAAVMRKPTIPVIIPPTAARYGGFLAADLAALLAKHVTHRQPLLEKDPLRFFPVSLDISNRKIRELGYEFEFDDVRRGVIETVDWMLDEGKLENGLVEKMKKGLMGIF